MGSVRKFKSNVVWRLTSGMPIIAEILKNLFYVDNQTPKMLLEVFEEHNAKYRELIGKEVVKATILRYERASRYLEEFMKEEYKMNDIPLRNINHEFVSNFEFFIKTEKNCTQNAAVKYMKILKKIITLAITNKWMTDNPFSGVKFKQTQSNREFLSEEELHIIMAKEFDIPRLVVVRDIFVLYCLSGLAFTDINHLRPEHITKDPNGESWIRKPREKTNNMCLIPLFDNPALLAEKYKNHPIAFKRIWCFPYHTIS